MLGRVDGSGHVRGGDDREVAVQPVRLVRDDEFEAAPLERLELVARLGREDQDRPVGLGADESIHEAGLLLVEVERRTQHGLEVELVESIGDAGDDPREVVAVEHRGRDADQPGATGRDGAQRAAGREVELPDHLEHGLARLLRHIGPVVQNPRHGRDGHTCLLGDVSNGRSSGSTCSCHAHGRQSILFPVIPEISGNDHLRRHRASMSQKRATSAGMKCARLDFSRKRDIVPALAPETSDCRRCVVASTRRRGPKRREDGPPRRARPIEHQSRSLTVRGRSTDTAGSAYGNDIRE